MDRHIKKDISWWANDPLMRSHVGENAYLYIDKEFKEECSDDFLKFLFYTINPNEMESYIQMYNSNGEKASRQTKEGE